VKAARLRRGLPLTPAAEPQAAKPKGA